MTPTLESRRLSQRKQETYAYFLREVDPIIANCITHLLIAQPQEKVAAAMLSFLKGETPMAVPDGSVVPETDGSVTKRDQRMYLATKISPILTRLMNGLAKLRPANVTEYLCAQLQTYVDNNVCFDVKPEDVPPPKPSAAARRPFTARSKLDEAVAFDRSSTGASLSTDRPGTAPQMKTADAGQGSSSAAKKAPALAGDGTHQQSLPALPTVHKNMQIALLGKDKAGKTSLVNSLQGNFDAAVKATLGFRPTTMMLGADTTVKLYDLGGGKKIRDIWEQYYHDVHAVMYVVDAAAPTEEEWQEAKALFQQVQAQPLLDGKPFLVVGNKADLEGAVDANTLCQKLGVDTSRGRNVITCTAKGTPAAASTPTGVAEAASSEAQGAEGEEQVVDKRLEQGLEWLLAVVSQSYDEINRRVNADIKRKAVEEAKKRLQRERKVLRNKIASVFFNDIQENLRPENIEPASPDDVYDSEEGLKFLADEIGTEVEKLSVDARDVAAWVGYQRLALQIVGALSAPISKKKTPMTWVEIKEMVTELRLEMGLE